MRPRSMYPAALMKYEIRTIVSLLVLCALCAWPMAAFAQDTSTSFQVEHFEPLPSQGTNTLNIARSDILGHMVPSGGVMMHYVNDPIQLQSASGAGTQRIIANQVKAELYGSFGLFDIAEIGLVAPLVLFQNGDDLAPYGRAGESVQGFAVADLRVIPKVQILNPGKFAGFGLAAVLPIYIPIGDTGSFNSDGAVRIEPRLVADWRHPAGVGVSVNLAYQLLRPEQAALNFVSDDVFRWGIGLELPTGVRDLSVIGSAFGNISFQDARAVPGIDNVEDLDRGQPVELLGGVQMALPYDLIASVAAGAGVTSGVGAPDVRVVASFGYTPRTLDRDEDGILDVDDACPARPEDLDGWEDEDGCPDLDNDNDGVFDDDDGCKNVPEDLDEFEDEDGCPDLDNDNDKIPDEKDECKNEPEDRDEFEDEDGCPDLDNDDDGIPDKKDDCPLKKEDQDGWEDEDGCPDPDNDGDTILDKDDKCPDVPGVPEEDGCPTKDKDKDGIPDKRDKCPNKPETYNGIKDKDGCPDGKQTVVVTKTNIKILQKVYFATNKAKIKSRSYRLLRTVAAVVNANPQITKIQIEGHTDDAGEVEYNMDLSQRRAEAVRDFLIKEGVAPTRLKPLGYGESKPRCKEMFVLEELKPTRKIRRKIKACRADNRRVEFKIVEIGGKPVTQKGEDAVIEER